MEEKKPSFRMAVRQLVADAARDPAVPVTVRELMALQAGELDGDALEELRERLVWQPEAAAAALDLARAADTRRSVPEDVWDERQIDQAWVAMTERLERQEQPSSLRTRTGAGARLDLSWSLVAVLTIAILGLLAYIAAQHHEASLLAEPRGNLVVASLRPMDRAIDRTIDVESVEIPGSSERLVLILNWPEPDPDRSRLYRATVRAEDGELVGVVDGLIRATNWTFTVDLDATTLAPGRYRIDLAVADSATSGPLATYAFDLERSKPDPS